MKTRVNKDYQYEIIQILKTVLEHNYFQINEYYKQTDGLAMGAPTSAVIAETYMEHTQIYPILTKQQIVAYSRYVDILIIYDEKKTNKIHTLNEFNKLQPTINFTLEKEQQESISFLDITIHCKHNNLQFSIYRKPTQTDIIIPKSQIIHSNIKCQVLITY
jgi:hypothetical protein